ncbi:MAG: heme NO-binding domain-containing protein [Planctomycetes bacterium]|nr:heme NO-binding domain-containing protein [Planctomycetota bacterium]
MKGVVFTEFVDWIELRHGVPVLDAVLLDAELPHGGAYTSAGNYDWGEMVALLEAASARLATTPGELLRAYGRHLFGVFARQFPQLLGGAASLFDFLERVGSFIHDEVAKLGIDTDLPPFSIRRGDTTFALEYRSPRSTAELAAGLVEGCLGHFGVVGSIRAASVGDVHRLAVTLQEAACPSR